MQEMINKTRVAYGFVIRYMPNQRNSLSTITRKEGSVLYGELELALQRRYTNERGALDKVRLAEDNGGD